VYDDELIRQMDIATFREGFKWEVILGHDDILVAAFLAIVAMAQYPPPNILSYSGNVYEGKRDRSRTVQDKLNAQSPLHLALRMDLRQIFTPRGTARSVVGSCRDNVFNEKWQGPKL
jgi:hypothetical protein